jgi:hypothetical protein
LENPSLADILQNGIVTITKMPKTKATTNNSGYPNPIERSIVSPLWETTTAARYAM